MTKHITYKKGDMSDTLFNVNDGKVKVFKFTVNGKEQILCILPSGEFFGE